MKNILVASVVGMLSLTDGRRASFDIKALYKNSLGRLAQCRDEVRRLAEQGR